VRKIKKEGFRDQMGMLGQRENAFLADRIFDVFDADCDGTLNFDEFVRIFDILMKGSEKEKNLFSFKLFDVDESGTLTFDEFRNYFSHVVTNWSSLVNDHIKLDLELLR
jgi:Ca2+-binding EF-hand superfamily protein